MPEVRNEGSLSRTRLALAGVQWFLFMFANTVVIPLSIGAAFHQSSAVIMATMRISFIFTGLACILQALFGHRYALMEGQSGLWWGVMLSLGAVANATGIDLLIAGGGMATGIILSSLVVSIAGLLGIGSLLKRLFMPAVMGVFLFLLAGQLTMVFFRGMVGLSNGNLIDIPVAALSFLLVFLVILINVLGKGSLGNFAILIGIAVGWIAHASFFPSPDTMAVGNSVTFVLFPLGAPNLELSFVITAFLAGLLNSANTVATIRGAEQLYGDESDPRKYRRSFFLTGINGVFAGLFGLVPYAPYTSSLGFLQATRILHRSAFILGGILFSLIGLVPALIAFFYTLPISVGSAVLFVAYLQLIGSALKSLKGMDFNSRTIYRLALPMLLGFAVMGIPSTAFASLPAIIRPLASNGLLVGILVALLVENLVGWDKVEQ
ncbi:uracil/xanthine transporter [Treponema sp.]